MVDPLLDTLNARRGGGAGGGGRGDETGDEGAARGGGAGAEMQAPQQQRVDMAELQEQVKSRMGQLYMYFKEMHDQDRGKLR